MWKDPGTSHNLNDAPCPIAKPILVDTWALLVRLRFGEWIGLSLVVAWIRSAVGRTVKQRSHKATARVLANEGLASGRYPVLQGTKGPKESLTPLSRLSSVVHGLKSVNQIKIYESKENRKEAEKTIQALRHTGEGA